MNDPQIHTTSVSRRLWNLITKGWVANVPADVACCEFNCRKLHCEQGEWESCENRLKYMAVGKESQAGAANTSRAVNA